MRNKKPALGAAVDVLAAGGIAIALLTVPLATGWWILSFSFIGLAYCAYFVPAAVSLRTESISIILVGVLGALFPAWITMFGLVFTPILDEVFAPVLLGAVGVAWWAVTFVALGQPRLIVLAIPVNALCVGLPWLWPVTTEFWMIPVPGLLWHLLTCGACSLAVLLGYRNARISVFAREGIECFNCAYNLRGLGNIDRCPECGARTL